MNKQLMETLEFTVMNAITTLAEHEDGSTDEVMTPKEIADLIDEACTVSNFIWVVARKTGEKLPLKYTKILNKVHDLYLIIHPELRQYVSSLWLDDVPENPTPKEQKWASTMLRTALEQVYHVKVNEGVKLEPAVSWFTRKNLEEAAAVAAVEQLLENPDNFDESGEIK